MFLIKKDFKVKLRNDMPDDMLYDAIKTTERVLKNVTDFEVEGSLWICFSIFEMHFTSCSKIRFGLCRKD